MTQPHTILLTPDEVREAVRDHLARKGQVALTFNAVAAVEVTVRPFEHEHYRGWSIMEKGGEYVMVSPDHVVRGTAETLRQAQLSIDDYLETYGC